MSNRTVCENLLDILAEAGVKHIFGIPGDAINDLVEAIRNQDKITFIQVRHEEAGAFAASAQAKLTERLAVCVGTAGPGAIHLLNGLYDAKLDHAPVLAITGQVETEYIGTDYHQEADLYTLFKDVTVFNERIMNPSQTPALGVRACQEALAHRSVTHLSIPTDIASQKVPNADLRPPVLRNCGLTTPCEAELKRAAKLLNESKKPVILAGIGCKDARQQLINIAETLSAPIIRTLRAKDILPDDHILSLGGLGQLGTKPAVNAIDSCDALLMVGTDFPYHDFYPDGKPAVQIDMDLTRIGKRYPVTVGLAGHAGPTLEALTQILNRKNTGDYLEELQKKMNDWREEIKSSEFSQKTPIKPQALARAIGEAAKDDAIFICDTGAVTVWAARHLPVGNNQRFTLSSALASMGFGLPGAIGAQLAYPERQVIALCGDGGFAMLMSDFLTAVKYELPIKVVVFNNYKLGLIQMEQEVLGYPEYQTGLHNPNFAKFAELCGGQGVKVTDPAEIGPTLREAFSSTTPYIVDVEINPEEVTMPPKIKVKHALGYGMAKVREFVGS